MLEMFVRVRGLRASERASVREIGTAESGAEYPVLAILLSPLPLSSLIHIVISSPLPLPLPFSLISRSRNVCIKPPLAIGIRADELMHLPAV